MCTKTVDPIFVRISDVLGTHTRKQMMEGMGYAYNTYKTWRHVDRIPERRLHEFAEKHGVRVEWLISGEGEKYRNKRKKKASA